ncbi:MAG TPA: ABC transporter substrate-binding protein [Eoetvoesiella sp.]|uniref:ABC transporter substrate-binding protein n=1 Tax=Eoetvoesiella sp. TaxID=1966355 RepID=UPI002BDDFE8D|nr:ABC transporter substrate-binding protein [Eoetvoesiella sp.]HWK63229.1 ABC transporter substrate-binding protein [Eoetvoesiella sp.]
MEFFKQSAAIAVLALATVTVAHADIKVGITLALTGPAASAGLPQKNTVPLLPTEIGGEKVRYIVLDDGTDPTNAVKNAKKLVFEDKVDLLIGSTATPGTIAVAGVALETQTPHIGLAAFDLPPEQEKWSFKSPWSFQIAADGVVERIKANGGKTIGFIGFSDSLGETWLQAISKAAKAANIRIVAVERFNRTDTSVLSQALKVVAAKPDAVVVGATSAAAAVPQLAIVDRGYKGPIYHTHATATPDFIRMAGKAAEGAIMPAFPIVVAEQLPDAFPGKAQAMAFVRAYEGKYGVNTRTNFAAHLWDAALLLKAAAPSALAKATPGTAKFRAALRDSLESIKNLPVSNGVVSMSPTDHNGFNSQARVMVQVKDGKFQIIQAQ